MKRVTPILAFLIFSWIGFQPAAFAIPTLQIYIPGATYDTDGQTWVINSYHYELDVIGASRSIQDVKLAFAVPTGESGSIVLKWLTPNSSDYGAGSVSSLKLIDPDKGSDINRLSYSAYRASYSSGQPNPATYGFALDGTPAMGDGRPLPPHDVFPTDFFEYFVGDFGMDQTVQNYIPGYESGDTAQGEMRKFYVDVSGYTWVDIVAYDHVVLGKNKARYVFSPFSHDGGGETPVPEPATMMLFGSGLLCLAAIGKRKLYKN